MSFPRYSEYKDSGVEWLGEVPAHWDVKQLKYLVTCLDGQRIPLNGVERYSKQGSVPYWGANKIMDYVDEAVFDEELVLLGEDGAPFFDVGKPVAFHSSGPVWPNNHIHVLRPGDSAWVKSIVYGLNATNYIDFVEGSTRDKLTQSRMMSIPLAWPPPDERNHIDSFLNHETARIDALVEEQQRLIELLKEKRQAVISQAVTKGLDPDVPMKDSGVEWLGEVPAHWEVSRLKYCAEKIVDCPHETPVYRADGEFLVIRTADIQKGVLEPSAMYRVDFEQYNVRIRREPLLLYDIVYGREGERWGHAALVPESGRYCLGQRMMQFRCRPNVSSSFLMWQLNSTNIYRQGDVDTVGATSPHVNVATIRDYRLALPDFNEQVAIAKYIESRLDEIDTLIDEANLGIRLLQERRSALISAAVTGKIDVRGWNPPAGTPTIEPAQAEMV